MEQQLIVRREERIQEIQNFWLSPCCQRIVPPLTKMYGGQTRHFNNIEWGCPECGEWSDANDWE